MKAAFEMFKTFNTVDAEDNRNFSRTKLQIPVLTIEGDKAMGGALQTQAKLVATDVTSILMTDTGHWLMEQRPAETKAALSKFLTQNKKPGDHRAFLVTLGKVTSYPLPHRTRRLLRHYRLRSILHQHSGRC